MIKLQPGIISGIRSAESADELGFYLQQAIKLESDIVMMTKDGIDTGKPGGICWIAGCPAAGDESSRARRVVEL